jgi:RNA-directed DNA polymerase
MGKLFDSATEQIALKLAWQRIRSNGAVSASGETRSAIEAFARTENQNIFNIQRLLRTSKFEFEPQKGVLKKKKSGGSRGIVMASVHNRVVERAWLDCLQKRSKFVKEVVNLPTSVGGVPHRSVPHGLKLIREAFDAGKSHYVRSDISGFFDHIPRKSVLETIAREVDDEKFLKILDAATTVVLANEVALGEERRIFPTDNEGVAQGSPLSPLFGNILLYDFDVRFNDRGIVCIRFIDDFILLGDSERNVNKAFCGAKDMLRNMGLNCHDPYSDRVDFEKAKHGRVEDGFVFLGYDIRPGLFQPSRQARQKLEKVVDGHIYIGKRAISEVKKAKNSFENRQRYAQTLSLIDRVMRGWGEAFSYGNSPSTLEDLDYRIDAQLDGFRNWFSAQMRDQDWKTKRRLGGVCLLSDVSPKSLNDVPFVLDEVKRFRRSFATITISTDGSLALQVAKKGRDRGPGGWAFVVHGTGEERSGSVSLTTNNRMELKAVIEAIRFVSENASVIIRTDSQYVSNAVNVQATIKSNADLWQEYRGLCGSRRIKVEWVKGHAGDPNNERADILAGQAAKLATCVLPDKKTENKSDEEERPVAA